MFVSNHIVTCSFNTLSSPPINCNPEVEACRLPHQGHHEEVHFEHPFGKDTTLWLQQWQVNNKQLQVLQRVERSHYSAPPQFVRSLWRPSELCNIQSSHQTYT